MYPNLIIAGAPKCGTTSLFDYLIKHPEVGGSSIKETRYFIDSDYSLFNPNMNVYSNGIEGYAKYFDHDGCKDKKIICEATPDYLYQKTTLDNIRRLPTSDEVQIVFILRNPAYRAYSLYSFAKGNMAVIPESMTFSELIHDVSVNPQNYTNRPVLGNIVQHGFYWRYIENWLDRYQNKIIVLKFEEMKANPNEFMKRIAFRLGIDTGFYEDADLSRSNKTVSLRSRGVHDFYRKVAALIPSEIKAKLQPVKKIYKSINYSEKNKTVSNEDISVLKTISENYAQDIEALEQNFSLDLSDWVIQ